MTHDVEDTILYTDPRDVGHAFYIQGSDQPNEDGITYAHLTHVILDRNGYDAKVVERDHFTPYGDAGISGLGLAYDSVYNFIHVNEVPLEKRWAQYAAEEAAERNGW